jgi:hypothetical protein
MNMKPSTEKTWKVLDIQVFMFSDLGTNGMDVVYSINRKGKHVRLTKIHGASVTNLRTNP